MTTDKKSIGGYYQKPRNKNIQLSAAALLLVMSLILAAPAAAIEAVINAPPTPSADDFILPAPIVNPQTVYDEFYNMRLEFFLPKTEPLIKETFGAAPRFVPEAFWEYESYYSRAIGFATNLPTLAKIEYGPTPGYGYATEQSESYYYQHLIYITGLEPGRVYHYRIKIKDSDGIFMVSQDYAFATPAIPADVVRVPQDLTDQSLPYKLTGDNKKYLLTEDIYAPNGGIVLHGNNVELDLGGNTIVYDNEPNLIINENTHEGYEIYYSVDATFGVRSGLWNYKNHRIFNGTIRQGANGGRGLMGCGYNPYLNTHLAGLEIAGVTADYYGDSVSGISVNGTDNYIHHNVVYDRGTVVDNRHIQMRAISGEAENRMAYNSVRRCRQTGIYGNGEFWGNEVYCDSFCANSFLFGCGGKSDIRDNKAFGLGYCPIGIGSYNSHDMRIRNNFIYMHAYAPSKRDSEYDRLTGVTGFRFFGAELYEYDENLFENNVVVCKGHAGANYIRALWICSAELWENTVIRDNVVKVELMTYDMDLDRWNIWNDCYTCVDLTGNLTGPDDRHAETLFVENRFITNYNYVTIGTGYGCGRNASFYRNAFERIDRYDAYFNPLRIGYWIHCSRDNKFIDSILGPGVDFDIPFLDRYKGYWSDFELSLDIGVSSPRTYADAATGAPLGSRAISWETDGGDSGAFVTGDNGEYYMEWLTARNEIKAYIVNEKTQTRNATVTFTTSGYLPVTWDIADLQGPGPAILFEKEPDIYIDLPIGGIWGGGSGPYAVKVSVWAWDSFDGAEIYRSDTPGGVYVPVAAETAYAAPGTATYIDTGLKPVTTYYYKARLINDGKFGNMSGPVALSTGDIEAGGVWSHGAGPFSIGVNVWTWYDFDGAEVYRSDTPDGEFRHIMTCDGPPPYIDEAGLSPDTTYYYKVRLYKDGHCGPLSETAAMRTGDLLIDSFYRGSYGCDFITFNVWTWHDYDGFEVYRSESPDGPYELAVAGEPYVDVGLQPDTVYYYKARLYKDGFYGPLVGPIAVRTDDY